MPRSLAFLPAVVDSLESRVVLSAAHPVVAEAAQTHHKAAPAHVAQPSDLVAVKRQTFSTGLVQTTHRTLLDSGTGQITAQDNITSSDGTSEIDLATGTQNSNGTVTVQISKTLSTGVFQNETDTSTTRATLGTLQADGTIVPGAARAGLVATTNFTKVTTQAGLGTQTIVGSSNVGKVGKNLETITNQQVTNFDGTVDQVHIVTKQPANSTSATMSSTVTQADGSAVTTTSTIKILSGSIDGLSIV